MAIKSKNGGRDSRSLLVNQEYPTNLVQAVKDLQKRSAPPSGGVRSGGDPDFGFELPSPFIVSATPSASWVNGRFVAALTLTLSYDPRPDHILLEAEIVAESGHPGFWRQVIKEGAYSNTWVVSDIGITLGAVYAVRVRANTRSRGYTRPSEWADGINFPNNLVIPAQVQNLRLAPDLAPYEGYQYINGGAGRPYLRWDHLNPQPQTYQIYFHRDGSLIYNMGQDGNRNVQIGGSFQIGVPYTATIFAQNGSFVGPISAPLAFTIPIQPVPTPSGLQPLSQRVMNGAVEATFGWQIPPGPSAERATTIDGAGRVTSIDPTYTGSGYWLAPSVRLTPPPVGGVQATAIANVANGLITGYTITNQGLGYAVAPTASIIPTAIVGIEPISATFVQVWIPGQGNGRIGYATGFPPNLAVGGLLPGRLYSGRMKIASLHGVESGYSATITFITMQMGFPEAGGATSLEVVHIDSDIARWITTPAHTSTVAPVLVDANIGTLDDSYGGNHALKLGIKANQVAQVFSLLWAVNRDGWYVARSPNRMYTGVAGGSVIKDEVVWCDKNFDEVSRSTVYNGVTQSTWVVRSNQVQAPLTAKWAKRAYTVGNGAAAAISVLFGSPTFEPLIDGIDLSATIDYTGTLNISGTGLFRSGKLAVSPTGIAVEGSATFGSDVFNFYDLDAPPNAFASIFSNGQSSVNTATLWLQSLQNLYIDATRNLYLTASSAGSVNIGGEGPTRIYTNLDKVPLKVHGSDIQTQDLFQVYGTNAGTKWLHVKVSGQLSVANLIESTSGGFKFPDATTLTTGAVPILNIPNIFTAPQTVTVSDAATNTVSTVLTLGHNTSGTPLSGFGSGIVGLLETSTTPDRPAWAIYGAWLDPLDVSRSSYLSFQTVNKTDSDPGNLTEIMRVGFGALDVAGKVTANAAPTQNYSGPGALTYRGGGKMHYYNVYGHPNGDGSAYEGNGAPNTLVPIDGYWGGKAGVYAKGANGKIYAGGGAGVVAIGGDGGFVADGNTAEGGAGIYAKGGTGIGTGTVAPAAYLDGNVEVIGSATIRKDQNTGTHLYIRNESAGVSSYTSITLARSLGATIQGYIAQTSDGNTIWGASLLRIAAGSGDSGGLQIATEANAPIVFQTNNTTRLTLLGTGNFGVGVGSPAYPLDVSGAINGTSYRVGGTAGVSGSFVDKNGLNITVTNGIITSIV